MGLEHPQVWYPWRLLEIIPCVYQWITADKNKGIDIGTDDRDKRNFFSDKKEFLHFVTT